MPVAQQRIQEQTASAGDIVSIAGSVVDVRFARELPPVHQKLVAGENDQAIAPEEADRVAEKIGHAQVQRLPGLGHLAHEEDAAAVGARIIRFAEEIGV